MSGTETKEAEALAVAQAWLTLVDEGRYGEAWDDGADLMRGAVGRDEFAAAVGGVRAPLGDVEARDRSSSTYATELPGAPDGEYVVIQFTTRFAHKAHAVETITPMLQPDGSWKVSGYFIK